MKRLDLVCIRTFNPYYSFRTLEKNETVIALHNLESGWIRLESTNGHFLGTIANNQLNKYFN